MARALLDSGADVNSKTSTGMTALAAASQRHPRNVSALLKDAGAKP